MKVRADTEVAVLSARTDLDLAISTWLPGYVAQRTDDPDVVMDIARRGGVVLIDLGSPRHKEWEAALRDRGFDGPTVFLNPRGDVTIDLRDRVVVSSPPSLSGLLAGFEEAQLSGSGPRRRRDPDGVARTTGRGHRRRTPAPPAAPSGPSQLDGPGPGEQSEARGPVERSEAPESSSGGARRARRLDRHREAEPSVPRARRSGRQHGVPASASRRARRRPAVADQAGAEAADLGEVGAAGTGPAGGIDAEAERNFQAAFRAAETQPGVRRRIATPDGRIRVQTEEELFAGQPASAPAAEDLGTVLTPAPSGQHRARAGA